MHDLRIHTLHRYSLTSCFSLPSCSSYIHMLVGFCDLTQYLPWVGYWFESQLQMTPFWIAANISVVKQWWDLTLWENMNLHTPCNVASRLTRDPGMSSQGLDHSAANPVGQDVSYHRRLQSSQKVVFYFICHIYTGSVDTTRPITGPPQDILTPLITSITMHCVNRYDMYWNGDGSMELYKGGSITKIVFSHLCF